MEIGDWWLGIGGWELVVGGSGGQSLVGWWLGVGLVAVIGHWRFSRLTGWLSSEAWFSVRGLEHMLK